MNKLSSLLGCQFARRHASAEAEPIEFHPDQGVLSGRLRPAYTIIPTRSNMFQLHFVLLIWRCSLCKSDERHKDGCTQESRTAVCERMSATSRRSCMTCMHAACTPHTRTRESSRENTNFKGQQPCSNAKMFPLGALFGPWDVPQICA